MSQRKIAIVDVDDTIADLKQELMHALDRETGKSVHWSKWTGMNVERLYGLSFQEMFDTMIKHNVIDKLSPHSEAKEVLDRAKSLGTEIIIVTARGWHPSGKESTIKWLQNHKIPFDEVITVPIPGCKVDAIKKFGKVSLAVDDNVKHVDAFQKSGIVENVYLYATPWNEKVSRTRFNRINSLHKILESLER